MMTFYAVVRDKHYGMPGSEAEPGYVMLVERETPASLIGSILKDDGEIGDWLNGFDTRPTYTSVGWGENRKRVREKPGRVSKDRYLTKHGTFEEAREALSAAKSAWTAADDERAYRVARDAYSEAFKAFQEAEQALRWRMAEELSPLQAAKTAAVVRLNQTKADILARQSVAAIAAAVAVATEASAAQGIEAEGQGESHE